MSSPKRSKKLQAIAKDPRKLALLAKQQLERANDARRLNPHEVLFGEQLAFILDESKAKVACCSRRAGKSYSLAFFLIDLATEHSSSLVPYITTTRESAKNIIWPPIQDICRKYDIEITMKQNTGDVVFKNGSRIILRGCDNIQQMDKLRGPKYPGAVIDEAQYFPDYLKTLIEEVLEPACMDYWGSILVCGTPGPVRAGVFYDMVTGRTEGWSVHGWTVDQNVAMNEMLERQGTSVKRWLAMLRSRRGWTKDTPQYLREYRGKWVQDPDSRVYKDSDLNYVDSPLPSDQEWEYVLGVDLGYNDPSAFCVVCYCEHTGEIRVVESFQEPELTVTEIAVAIEKLRKRYSFESIVVDSGGGGSKIVLEDLKKSHSLPVQAAEKDDKVGMIEVLNTDFMTGRLTIDSRGNKNDELKSQLRLLQWDDVQRARGKYKEDRRTPNHLCDAMLYAVRKCHADHPTWTADAPDYGTKEWFERHEEEMWERVAEEAERNTLAHLSVFDDQFDTPFPEW